MIELLKAPAAMRLLFRAPAPVTLPAAPSDVRRYSPVAMSLHWIIAALILFVGILGLLLDDWPKDTKLFWINIHAQGGLLILVLLMARIWWRRRVLLRRLNSVRLSVCRTRFKAE